MTQFPLSYENPQTAVFLRILAWEHHVARREPSVQDVVTEHVQAARKELGLSPLQGGAAHDFIQKLRVGSEPSLSPGCSFARLDGNPAPVADVPQARSDPGPGSHGKRSAAAKRTNRAATA